MKDPAAILNFIQPEKIQTVIEDLRLAEAGYSRYYAIDPHEIFNFCFPLRTSDEQSEVDNMDEFAADQAALYEVCFKRNEKPLLIGDYVAELEGLMRYSTDILSKAYDAAEIVDALIDKGGVEEISEQQNENEDVGQIVQAISEKFHIVLAVAMGIYSLGALRFRNIYRELVLELKGLPENNPALREHFERYRETDLSLQILSELMKGRTWADQNEFRRKRRSAFFDAKAIDQLIQVNKSLLQPRPGKKSSIVLYLSSAQRTEHAFQMRVTHKQLPLLNGVPFDFHRDRKHIFYEVAYRSAGGDIAGTIRNLEKVKRSVEELRKSTTTMPAPTDLCSDCVLNGGHPTECQAVTSCEHLKTLLEPLEQRSTEIRNLALTQTLERYQELKLAKPAGASQKKLMQFFNRVFEDKHLKNVARLKKLQKEQLVFLQLRTPKNWARTREATKKHQHLRTGRDSITGTLQYLPVNPNVKRPEYKLIAGLILEYFRTPPQGDETKIEVIDEAYGRYLDREAMVNDLEAEHELVRCLLYLTLPDTDGDQKAFNHALEMLAEPAVLAEDPDAEEEFRYLACWSGRRLKKFSRANEEATLGIEKWPNDSRFYHGRSLSKLAEWEDEKTHPKPIQLLLDAEQDARKSLELYTAKTEEHREFIGVAYNNIAYINTLMHKVAGDRKSSEECLRIAREAITKLKEYVPESEWTPLHPNYFHTEALLDYFQAISNMDGHRDVNLLLHAKQQIGRALACVAKDPYKELHKSIDNLLRATGARN